MFVCSIALPNDFPLLLHNIMCAVVPLLLPSEKLLPQPVQAQPHHNSRNSVCGYKKESRLCMQCNARDVNNNLLLYSYSYVNGR